MFMYTPLAYKERDTTDFIQSYFVDFWYGVQPCNSLVILSKSFYNIYKLYWIKRTNIKYILWYLKRPN